MALPHPHGDAAGQIGEGAYYDTGVVSGTTGGKFIGFGEAGTSAIGNRAHWALSENIDHVYQIMAADRAIPEAISYAVGGGGEATKQITGSIWVGDTTYPAAAEGLPLLFSVFDDLYNELQDGSGNKVVAAVVRDSTNVTDVYKDGFVTDPVVTFKTVDASGADVQNPYTIPAATDVKLLYAARGDLENLPTDIFSRYKVISGEEVPAGTLLQDGSRPMAGNLDINDNNLLNVDEIHNVSGSPLDVISDNTFGLSAAGAALVSTAELTLNDQHLSAGVPVSETNEAALSSAKSSLVGALNSNFEILQSLQGDALLNRTGSITFTGATGQIDYPELVYTYNGTRYKTAAGNVTASAAVTEYLYIQPSTGNVIKTTSPSAASGIPLTKHYWDGATAFTTSLDIRTARNGWSALKETTVSAREGADFSDLQEALDALAAANVWNGMPVIRLVGDVTITSTVTLRGAVKIIGDSGSRILADISTTESAIDCGGNTVHLEDFEIRYDNATATQGAAYGAIENVGSNSTIRGVVFNAGTYAFGNAIILTSGTAYRVLVEKCIGTNHTKAFLFESGGVFHESVVRDCNIQIDRTAGTTRAVTMSGGKNSVVRCVINTVNSGASYISMIGGNYFLADKVVEESITDTDNATSLQFPDTDIDAAWVRGCAFIANGALTSLRNSASGYLRVYVEGSKFFGRTGINVNPTSIDGEESLLHIIGCEFGTASSSSVVTNSKIRNFLLTGCTLRGGGTTSACVISSYAGAAITNNHFYEFTGDVVEISGDNSLVEGNHFYDCAGTDAFCVLLSSTRASVVRGNTANYNLSNTAGFVRANTSPGCLIEGNSLENLYGDEAQSFAVFYVNSSADVSIKKNQVYQCSRPVNTGGTNRAIVYAVSSDNVSVLGNYFDTIDEGLSLERNTIHCTVFIASTCDKAQINDNYIKDDIAAGPGNTIKAIDADIANVQINNNFIDLYGAVDTQSVSVAITDIDVSNNNRSVIIGNVMTDAWTDVDGDVGTEKSIIADGDYIVVMSNKGKKDVDVQGQNGVVVGNCMEAATFNFSVGTPHTAAEHNV